jgi:tyrosyl-tRNA synthetase
MNKINEQILNRGVASIYPSREYLQSRLEKGEKLTIYLGIDPTGPNLHLGHAIPVKKLGEFQKAGHKIILLLGDFTAMIGDPTDKSATRKQLTRKDVLNNLKGYKKQLSKIISFS